MRLLVTGAHGFIGRAVLEILRGEDIDVRAVTRRGRETDSANLTWHQCDLLQPGAGAELVLELRPTHLLHLAWYTAPGLFWNSVENVRWAAATLDLVRAFHEAGGKRVVSAGTCAEYDWNIRSPLVEETPLNPDSLYGWAKAGCYQTLSAYAEVSGLSLAWARLFFVYGPHENAARLVPHVITSMIAGAPVVCRSESIRRDYMYVEDCATALVALLRAEAKGAFNICTGEAVSIREIVEAARGATGRQNASVTFKTSQSAPEIETVVGSNFKLRGATGWEPRYSLREGLRKSVSWWKSQAPST